MELANGLILVHDSEVRVKEHSSGKAQAHISKNDDSTKLSVRGHQVRLAKLFLVCVDDVASEESQSSGSRHHNTMSSGVLGSTDLLDEGGVRCKSNKSNERSKRVPTEPSIFLGNDNDIKQGQDNICRNWSSDPASGANIEVFSSHC